MFRNLGAAAELLTAKKELKEMLEKEIVSREELIKTERETIKTLKAVLEKLQ